MFNIKALLDLHLIIRTSSVNNFKSRDSTFIFTDLRAVEMLDNVRIPVPIKVLIAYWFHQHNAPINVNPVGGGGGSAGKGGGFDKF